MANFYGFSVDFGSRLARNLKAKADIALPSTASILMEPSAMDVDNSDETTSGYRICTSINEDAHLNFFIYQGVDDTNEKLVNTNVVCCVDDDGVIIDRQYAGTIAMVSQRIIEATLAA